MHGHQGTEQKFSDEQIHSLYKQNATPWSAGIVTITILILLLFIAYCLFITFLLLHGAHRCQIQIQLATSCILAHLPTAIFFHPGTIHLHMLKKAMTSSYCWFWAHFRSFTQIIIPYTLLMFSIERLMYIRNPTGHAQRIKRASHVTLLVFPWAISTILSLINVNVSLKEVITQRDFGMSNSTYLSFYTCFQSRGHDKMIADIIVRMVLGGAIPLWTCLIITIVVLGMWCCFKRKHALGRDYSMMGDQVEVTVRNSVMAVSVLNFLYIVMFIIEGITHHGLRLSYAALSFYGVIEGIVWVLTFVDVRNKFVALVPCTLKPAAESTTVNFKPENGSKA